MEELLSIVCSVYNAEKYLDKCVNSVLQQDYRNFEFIIVDDGSFDNSPNILDNYALKDNRIKVFHIENTGGPGAVNYGIKHSSGKYITFIDNDDWVEKDAYFESINIIKKKNVQMSVFNWRNVNENGEFQERDITNQTGVIDGKTLRHLIVENDFDFGGCYCFNRVIDNEYLKSKIGDNLYLNESLSIYYDRDYNVRALMYIDKVDVRNKIGYNYLVRNGSMCHNNSTKYFVGCIIGWQAIYDDFGSDISERSFERYNSKIFKNIWCLFRKREYLLAKNYWDLYKSNLVFKNDNIYSRCIKIIILNINSYLNKQ